MFCSENQKQERLKHLLGELQTQDEDKHYRCVFRANGCVWIGTVFVPVDHQKTEKQEDNTVDRNWFFDFVSRCCAVGCGYTVSAAKIYAAYLAFCNVYGITSRDTASFFAELVKRGFKITEAPDPQRPRIVISGLTIKT